MNTSTPPSFAIIMFGLETTGREVAQHFAAQIKGKTVLITGGTVGGLGVESALTIAAHKPKLIILTARSQAKLDDAFAAIRKEVPQAPLRGVLLDLASLKDVRRAAAEINDIPETIDLVIHNAGVALCPDGRTEDGFTPVLAANHYGPFLLTSLLLPKLLADGHTPRIVIIASEAHAFSKGFPWDDPNYEKEDHEYDAFTRYAESKVLNALFASALDKRARGRVQVFSATPGWTDTGLPRYIPYETKVAMGFYKEDGKTLSDAIRTPQQGIAPYMVAAFDPELPKTHPGGYVYFDCQPSPDKVAEWAKGEENEQKLWELSEKGIGEKFYQF